jgi:hypothetical protein
MNALSWVGSGCQTCPAHSRNIWRRQGRSYRRIQEILLEQCQLDVAYETLRRFVQRRERPCISQPEAGPVQPTAPPPVPTAAASADPYAEVRERMRQFKAEPVPVKPQPRFVYSEEDAIKPLEMLPKSEYRYGSLSAIAAKKKGFIFNGCHLVTAGCYPATEMRSRFVFSGCHTATQVALQQPPQG